MTKSPDKNSKRSAKRRNRGFQSLELSSRKHRRAANRLAISQTIAGTRYAAGTKVDPPAIGKEKTFLHTAGGKVDFSC